MFRGASPGCFTGFGAPVLTTTDGPCRQMPHIFIAITSLLNPLRMSVTPATSQTRVLTARRAGLGDIHLHTLRHACGYYLANRGHDLRLIQDYLGHREPRHTAHYTRVAAHCFEGLWDGR